MVDVASPIPTSAGMARTDSELCLQARQGSEQAYAAIMRRHNGRLFRIARSILKNDAEAEDAVQDAYVRAFLNLGELRDPASLAAWLGRITANEALGRLRTRRPTVALDEIENMSPHDDALWPGAFDPMPHDDPEATVTHKEIGAILEAAIDKLPTHFRMVLVACAIEQMSVEEAASCFSLPLNTVKTRLHRARRLLRQSLGAEFAAALPDLFSFGGAHCDRITARVLARLASISQHPSPSRQS
jgi:RNA polymerase sigma-70 factor (ECF subfamily)